MRIRVIKHEVGKVSRFEIEDLDQKVTIGQAESIMNKDVTINLESQQLQVTVNPVKISAKQQEPSYGYVNGETSFVFNSEYIVLKKKFIFVVEGYQAYFITDQKTGEKYEVKTVCIGDGNLYLYVYRKEELMHVIRKLDTNAISEYILYTKQPEEFNKLISFLFYVDGFAFTGLDQIIGNRPGSDIHEAVDEDCDDLYDISLPQLYQEEYIQQFTV